MCGFAFYPNFFQCSDFFSNLVIFLRILVIFEEKPMVAVVKSNSVLALQYCMLKQQKILNSFCPKLANHLHQ